MKEEILKRLDALADKLGTSAQFLFNLYVKQAHVQVVNTLTYGVFTLILGVAACYLLHKGISIQTNDELNWREQNKGIAPTIVGAILGVVAICFLIAFIDGNLYTALMNPQYWAFKEILHDLHGQ